MGDRICYALMGLVTFQFLLFLGWIVKRCKERADWKRGMKSQEDVMPVPKAGVLVPSPRADQMFV